MEQLPLDRIVIETDSYPQPFKKNPLRRTEPWHLPQVAEKVAELQRTDIEAVAAATTVELPAHATGAHREQRAANPPELHLERSRRKPEH